MDIVTAAQMRLIDRRAIGEYGIPGIVLMENAGLRVVEAIRSGGKKPRRVTVLAGPGNNGGDGLVVARHLRRETKVSVWLAAPPDDYRSDARTNLEILERLGHPVYSLENDADNLARDLECTDLVVDALLGTGTTREVTGLMAEVIRAVNNSTAPVLAVDIPSGVCADSGRVLGEAIKADTTITFGLPKRGLLLFPGAALTGRLEVADIGLPPQLLVGSGFVLLTPGIVQTLLPPRPPDGHKGTFGRVLIVAGFPGMTGAAVLAARAAQRGGAGLVTVACPRCVQPTVAAMVAEAVTLPLPDNKRGALQVEALQRLRESWQACDVLAMGPGLSTDDDIIPVLAGILSDCPLPVLLDADALNLLAAHPELANTRKGPMVITPHPGEAARLLGCGTEDVQADRPAAVRMLADRYRTVAVLKGAHTLVAWPEGTALNVTGNSGMASGGSGDALTGLMAALLAKGLTPQAAACTSVYLHGLAGDLASDVLGEDAMCAGDLIEHFGDAYLKLGKINM